MSSKKGDRKPKSPPKSRKHLTVSGKAAVGGAEVSGAPGLSPGEIIGDFEIIEEVGRGGMGVVYRAHEKALRRVVALKILHPSIAQNRSASKRFRREAVLAANLSHPNIVPVFSVDENDPPEYFTMEFVQGKSLKEKVEAEGYLNPTEAIRIATQACEALQYAHSRNIIHRDIKPHNLLLQNHVERVRITDFGIAQDITGNLAEVTQTHGIVSGTLAFMSPEQNLGRKLDTRTDIYSLGATVFYTLTGRPPYEARNSAELTLAFGGQPPPPPSHFNPEVPPALDRVILRMISVDMEHRPATATVAAADLADSLRYSAVEKQEENPSTFVKSRHVRFAMMLIVIGVGLLAIIFAILPGSKDTIPPKHTLVNWRLAPLVNTPANETSPIWSPDGAKLAFISDGSGRPQLHIVDTDGTNSWQVTEDPQGASGPVWSPDSRYLLYGQAEPIGKPRDLIKIKLTPDRKAVEDTWNLTNGKGPFATQHARFSPDGLWIAAGWSMDGWPRLRVLRDRDSAATPADWKPIGKQEGMSNHPAWSTDGKWIAYSSNANYNTPSEFRAVAQDGLNDKQLLSQSYTKQHNWTFAWSPGGDRLLLSDSYSGGGLRLTTPGGLDPVWLIRTPAGISHQAYSDISSPDKRSLVYSRKTDGKWDIWLVNWDGKNKRPVAATPGDDHYARFVRDGRICFQTDWKGNWDIYVAIPEDPAGGSQ